ncbi:MAG: TetR family transcriptional regulator [Qingshengfaniella sp.]
MNKIEKPAPPRKRDAAATRQRILDAARADFAAFGFTGARVDSIARKSQANVQMIYRYFGKKDDLYRAVLVDTYARIRERERRLDLTRMTPEAGVRRLITFTFDYMQEDPEFVAIIRNENVLGGGFIRDLPKVAESTTSLIDALADLLARGHESGVFKPNIDPIHLYVMILALCIVPHSQRSTLSVMLRQDLGAGDWLARHRDIVTDAVLTYLTVGG